MKIYNLRQYNQGISKYKLLSSTAGVGSIVTTKLGVYILITDINKWKFINWANTQVEDNRKIHSDNKKIYELSCNMLKKRGLEIVDDQRFVKFLIKDKTLDNLICLIKIPHMTLNEVFNSPNWKNHPIRKTLQKNNEPFDSVYKDYMISASHFPKWFKGNNGKLKKIEEWYSLWKNECSKFPNELKLDYFAPPRDATKYIRDIKSKNEDGNPIPIREYQILEQLNLVLICENGHLSDIPWSKYLKWKTNKITQKNQREDNGENLLSSDSEPCCSQPDLKWTENTTKSEGYGSIYIECLNCDYGSGKNTEYPKINLEGINSLQPYCLGHKPWEIDNNNPNYIPLENCIDIKNPSNRQKMKVRLVTANNIYFANCFSSLYIPMRIVENKSKELSEAIEILEERYKKRNDISKEDFWDKKIGNDFDEFIRDNGIIIEGIKNNFQERLKESFLKLTQSDENKDSHEHYRWQEYQSFKNNSTLDETGLKFNDIQLPTQLSIFFQKIQQVDELRVTNVQLDFTRVFPKQRIIRITENGDKEIIESTLGQNIYSTQTENLYVLPANEILGEGIFFQFNDQAIENWITNKQSTLGSRFSVVMKPPVDDKEQGAGTKRKLIANGYKHFLVHSFAHIIMRELEFSCGYPTASLKERLYISKSPNDSDEQMSGVLIYTAEGSEGSMGGLVSQGEPNKIIEIIKKGLERAINCSSDPLCWESEGQGIFDLNLSACFSCSLVSETACEEMNLGLDRRVLVDEDFGFFRELIS